MNSSSALFYTIGDRTQRLHTENREGGLVCGLDELDLDLCWFSAQSKSLKLAVPHTQTHTVLYFCSIDMWKSNLKLKSKLSAITITGEPNNPITGQWLRRYLYVLRLTWQLQLIPVFFALCALRTKTQQKLYTTPPINRLTRYTGDIAIEVEMKGTRSIRTKNLNTSDERFWMLMQTISFNSNSLGCIACSYLINLFSISPFTNRHIF